MERSYLFFYLAIGCWLLTLVAWFAYAPYWALAAGGMTLGSFLIHGFQQQVFAMFGKNKNAPEATPVNAVTPPVVAEKPMAVEKPRPIEEKLNNTVIASGVRFTGDLKGSGQVYIYGEVDGNVDAEDGLVKVMRNGRVKGNISCRELIIDGGVNGECKAESIEIEEHGNVNGALAYVSLSVKKGGVFVGQVSLLARPKEKTNVIGFVAENTASVAPAAIEEPQEKEAIITNKKRG